MGNRVAIQFKVMVILDTPLAAVLHTNGVCRLLTSNPADFAVFSLLQTVTP
jgi:hypothetical protein